MKDAAVTRREILRRMTALGAGSLLSAGISPASSAAITAATLAVSNTAIGAIGPAFAGLSYEKGQMTNPFFSPQNNDAIALFKLLGPSLLRLGGFSADSMTWIPNGAGRTPGQTAPSDIDSLAAFLKATGWQVLYSVNLAQSTPALTAAEVAYAVKSLGSLLYGIELGNEPDLYAGRYFPLSFGYSDYYALWRSCASAIRAQTPGVPITAPAVASNIEGYVAPLAQAEGTTLSLLTCHYYRGNGDLPSATIDNLVSSDPGIFERCEGMLAVSQATGVPYRMAETNSFWNTGNPGVEDSYASALWVIDHLFACASCGSLGANFHGGGNLPGHTPIADSNGVVVEARPEFYGITLFALAGTGAVLKTTLSGNLANATAYAIRGQDGSYSVIVNNKDQMQTLNVTLILPQSAVSAQLFEMTGPSLDAIIGVTIQGATIQPTGAFSPAPATVLLSPTFSVKPATAVLVKIDPPDVPPWTIAGPVAPDSIVTVYGTDLTPSVSMQDSSGVVTSPSVDSTSPGQINFFVPSTTAIGPAIVTIGAQQAAVQIAPVCPKLYVQNAADLASGYVVTNGADVALTSPIDVALGDAYLILFGTGIRGAGANVTLTIGGIAATVTYGGPQGVTAGLDQVNALIPAGLAGLGTVSVILTAAYIPANPVRITIA